MLQEAARLSGEVLAPINQEGDRQGSRLIDGVVRTPDRWQEAYTTFVEGGWNGAVNEPEYGGMGLPWLVNAAVQEMIHGANMSFALCPMLTQSGIEAIALNGSDAAEGALPAENGLGRVDRNDEPDGTASRLGPERCTHARRTPKATIT